jgi:small subunit ribosomal protein S21
MMRELDSHAGAQLESAHRDERTFTVARWSGLPQQLKTAQLRYNKEVTPLPRSPPADRKVVNCLAEVHLQDGETLESALRRFKRKVQQEDIVKEIKRHSFYLKPGEKRRTKEALARKRNRKKRPRDIE